MALSLASASTQYAWTASPAVTAVPFTFSLWVKPTTSINCDYMGLYDTGTTNNYHNINRAGGFPRATSNAAGTASSATWGSDITTGVWQHFLAFHDITTGTDRAFSLNGGTLVTQTTNRAPSSLDAIAIGALKGSTVSNPYNGLVAYACVWNVILSQGECLALSRGTHPLQIRPGNLKHFWPLIRDEHDHANGAQTLTLVGSPSFSADNPPVAAWPARVPGIVLPKPA